GDCRHRVADRADRRHAGCAHGGLSSHLQRPGGPARRSDRRRRAHGADRMSMLDSGDFRGRGWRFPIYPAANGGLSYVEGDENVVQSLELLLRTVAGERVMRPDLGTTVPTLVFEGDSEQNLHRLEVAI